jgi:hypothetical protein
VYVYTYFFCIITENFHVIKVNFQYKQLTGNYR